MKKFLYEYKAFKTKSETETSNPKRLAEQQSKVESPHDMGVLKWLRRERVTVTTRHNVSPEPTTPEQRTSSPRVGTIRTEEYKRDLAEFQARRSAGAKEFEVKRKCGRHSLPASCTACTADLDNSFSYEKKPVGKYKKKTHTRARSANPEDRGYQGLPSIQFLFQNQVFMPGNRYGTASYSEPQRFKYQPRYRSRCRSPVAELTQKQIDFEVDQPPSPPMFYKNNSLPFDVDHFLGCDEDLDGVEAAGDVKPSSRSSSECPRGDSCDDKLWEVMTELKSFDKWADEQLQAKSPNAKSEDSRSDTSAYDLPVASASNVDVAFDKNRTWNQGKWGLVPVQIKKLRGVTMEHVRKNQNTEINILRTCRHPNIILLMGLYPDAAGDINIMCETCVDTLYGILHTQGRILSAQTAVRYALDVANALVFLHMRGLVHTELRSGGVAVTARGAAKLAELAPCAALPVPPSRGRARYDLYAPEPQYANIDDTRETPTAPDCEPLISERQSEAYLRSQAVAKRHALYRSSEHYRWHAPELFAPDDAGAVHPCSKSDVYALSLVLWESCNAKIPWQSFTYEMLKEQYTLWKDGVRLPSDGTYPGGLLAILQRGLRLDRGERIDLDSMQRALQIAKRDLDEVEYIIIPARLSKRKSDFSSAGWDTTSPPDSEYRSPVEHKIQHEAVVHNPGDSSTDTSERDCSKSDGSPLYETIKKDYATLKIHDECYASDGEVTTRLPKKYDNLPEKHYSSACSTPIARLRARIGDAGTPGALQRSDSTEYCSILSPDTRAPGRELNADTHKGYSAERSAAKLSRSFTPKSYTPLHIKVPEFKLEGIRNLPKDQNGGGGGAPSYNFDVKNSSLPSMPIARSNKLRRNAWLAGELSIKERSVDRSMDSPIKTEHNRENNEDSKDSIKIDSAPETPFASNNTSAEKEKLFDCSIKECSTDHPSPESVGTTKDSFTTLRKSVGEGSSNSSPEGAGGATRPPPGPGAGGRGADAEILAALNVKPLVAIHERWIYEANRKTARSVSLPEHTRADGVHAVKPASHCVDVLPKSTPQPSAKRSPARRSFRPRASSPISGRNGGHWEQYCRARELIEKNVNMTAPTRPHSDCNRFTTWQKDVKGTTTEETTTVNSEPKIDRATDTKSIEEFIRDLIRKEFHHLLSEITDDATTVDTGRSEELINRGVANIVGSLKSEDHEGAARQDPTDHGRAVRQHPTDHGRAVRQHPTDHGRAVRQDPLDHEGAARQDPTDHEGAARQDPTDHEGAARQDPLTSFSRIRISGNSKPLLHITFGRGGESSLQVLDGCVNVTVCDAHRERPGHPPEDAPAPDDGHTNSLKRCQAFNAIQEARSTEDLYIDDDLSTHMQENFGGRVRLIPLHGSLHEVLCERRDECCLVRARRELGCDAASCGCASPDAGSRDAPDGGEGERPQERVLYKRSISLVEETIQRVYPKHAKARPKSEIFMPPIDKSTRALSNSSPSLLLKDRFEEVEVNLDAALSYHDSSSDECLKCQTDGDDFEMLERKIEEDIIASGCGGMATACGCLAKISEENLSVINGD